MFNLRENKNLALAGLVIVISTLGYGIVIPLLYNYSRKYGLNDFENGLLFSLFSICQFISTPIIGRMSDKYGRKPLLVVSLTGTAISFFMMAFAQSAILLLIARALDGITAGNIPVAQAVISDSTSIKNRAKGFGIIGASFGFGFTFGPAISALTVGYSDKLPFIIAGIITVLSVLLTIFLLPETNKHMGEVRKGKIFDFAKLGHALFDKAVGSTFLITLVYSVAFAMCLMFAYQPYALKILNLSTTQISSMYVIFGVIGMISQVFIVPKYSKWLGLKKGLSMATLFLGISFIGFFFTKSYAVFILISIALALSNSFVNPLLQAILSQETDEKSQGTILGMNASYASLGQIFGPILGGAITVVGIPYVYLVGAFLMGLNYLLSLKTLQRGIEKEHAF